MILYIYCAGGFGKEVFDIAWRLNRASGRWTDIRFIDDNPDVGSRVYDVPVCTLEHARSHLDLSRHEVAIATGEPQIRRILAEKVRHAGARLATLVDTTALVSHTAVLGDGVVIAPFASITSSSRIGQNVVLNAKAIVGHDIRVGDHSVLSSLVNVGGGSTIGALTYIGMGAQIKEGLSIGHESIVGMGSVVHHDIPPEVIALGNPARPMRKNVDKRVFRPAGQESDQ